MLTYLVTDLQGRDVPTKHISHGVEMFEIDRLDLESIIKCVTDNNFKHQAFKVWHDYEGMAQVGCHGFHKYRYQKNISIIYSRAGKEYYPYDQIYRLDYGDDIKCLLDYTLTTKNYSIFDMYSRIYTTEHFKDSLQKIKKGLKEDIGDLFPLWIDYNLFQRKNMLYNINACTCYWSNFNKPQLEKLPNLRRLITDDIWQLVLNELEKFYNNFQEA